MAILALAAGCKKKTKTTSAEERALAELAATTAAAVAPGATVGTFAVRPGDEPDADRLIAAVRAATVAPRALSFVHVHYVHANGKLDAKYGEALITTGDASELLPAPTGVDDPGRPIGAPVVDAPPRAPVTDCTNYQLAPGGVLTTEPRATCTPVAPSEGRDACTIARLWQLAIADGAPANALASFDLSGTGAGADWWVSIDDDPRNYHFNKRYEAAACRAVPEGASLPAEAMPIDGGAATTATIDAEAGSAVGVQGEPTRDALVAAMSKARPAFVKCAAGNVSARVTLDVTVDKAGKATAVAVGGTEDAKLRDCLATAARAATWPGPTTFRFPLVFTSSN